MNRMILAALALATLPAAAQARPDHDYSIDRAAANIVAQKIGELRGGFNYNQQPRITPAISQERTASIRSDGLAPAAELRFVVPVRR